MSSMIFWGTICVVGPFIYAALGGQPAKTSTFKTKSYEKETEEYFNKLPLEYQERYFKENLDLRYYKDDMTVGLTTDKNINTKHAVEISRRTGKPFNDINKTY